MTIFVYLFMLQRLGYLVRHPSVVIGHSSTLGVHPFCVRCVRTSCLALPLQGTFPVYLFDFLISVHLFDVFVILARYSVGKVSL